jgi:hypothetical protein
MYLKILLIIFTEKYRISLVKSRKLVIIYNHWLYSNISLKEKI